MGGRKGQSLVVMCNCARERDRVDIMCNAPEYELLRSVFGTYHCIYQSTCSISNGGSDGFPSCLQVRP